MRLWPHPVLSQHTNFRSRIVSYRGVAKESLKEKYDDTNGSKPIRKRNQTINQLTISVNDKMQMNHSGKTQ